MSQQATSRPKDRKDLSIQHMKEALTYICTPHVNGSKNFLLGGHKHQQALSRAILRRSGSVGTAFWCNFSSFSFEMATESFSSASASDPKRRRFADVVDVAEGDDIYPSETQLEPESSSQPLENDTLLDEDPSCISLREEAQKLQDMEHDLFLSKNQQLFFLSFL